MIFLGFLIAELRKIIDGIESIFVSIVFNELIMFSGYIWLFI